MATNTKPTIVTDPQPSTSPKNFVFALIGLIASLVAAGTALFFTLAFLSASSGTNASTLSGLVIGLMFLFASPVYILSLILVSLFSVRSIRQRKRRDIAVMGWIGVCLAFVPGIILFAVGLGFIL